MSDFNWEFVPFRVSSNKKAIPKSRAQRLSSTANRGKIDKVNYVTVSPGSVRDVSMALEKEIRGKIKIYNTRNNFVEQLEIIKQKVKVNMENTNVC